MILYIARNKQSALSKFTRQNGDITIQLSPKGKFNLELLELNGKIMIR